MNSADKLEEVIGFMLDLLQALAWIIVPILAIAWSVK